MSIIFILFSFARLQKTLRHPYPVKIQLKQTIQSLLPTVGKNISIGRLILHQTLKPFVSKRFLWGYWLHEFAQKFSCLEKVSKIFKVKYFKIFLVNFKILRSKVAEFILLSIDLFFSFPFCPNFPIFHFKIGERVNGCMDVEWISLLQNRLSFERHLPSGMGHPIEVFSPNDQWNYLKGTNFYGN